MKTIKPLILLIILLAIFLSADNVLAQTPSGAPLDVTYPPVPGTTVVPTTTTTSIPQYIEYLFYFLIFGSGLLALLALIMGGFYYISSVGNPDKLRNARDKIISALLGLAIVAGSYAILWQMNPLIFSTVLAPLNPIINRIPPGVYICKTMPLYNGAAISEVRMLEEIYQTERFNQQIFTSFPSFTQILNTWQSIGLDPNLITNPQDITIRDLIKARVDKLLDYIYKRCYLVRSEGEVPEDINNNVDSIWFVPELDFNYSSSQNTWFLSNSNEYGAAIFDNEDFTGIGEAFFGHMYGVGAFGGRFPVKVTPSIKVSSIKPFKHYTKNPMSWQVSLYAGQNYNYLLASQSPYMDILSVSPFVNYYGTLNQAGNPPGSQAGTIILPKPILNNTVPAGSGFPIQVPPESMRVEGSALAILYKNAVATTCAQPPCNCSQVQCTYTIKPPATTGTLFWKQTGYYFQIFSDDDSNLKDDYNLVWWNRCPGYIAPASVLSKCTLTTTPSAISIIGSGGYAQSTKPLDCCAEADADAITIISNVIPY